MEIDCAPGSLRPDDCMSGMCTTLGLEPADFTLRSKVFGCWVYEYTGANIGYIKTMRSDMLEYLRAMYDTGSIRYARVSND